MNLGGKDINIPIWDNQDFDAGIFKDKGIKNTFNRIKRTHYISGHFKYWVVKQFNV